MKVIATLIIILAVVAGAYILGMQTTIDECNRTDEFGRLVYKESFICSNSAGKRVTNER